MNRVVIKMDEHGAIEIFSDEPIEVYTVCDFVPEDRVYQLTKCLHIGVEKVQAELRNDPVGHYHDDQMFGTGHGPRKPPSKRKLEVVK
jgi:hypothetical protein